MINYLDKLDEAQLKQAAKNRNFYKNNVYFL